MSMAHDFIGCVDSAGPIQLNGLAISYARTAGVDGDGGLPILPGMSTVSGATGFYWTVLLELALHRGTLRILSSIPMRRSKGFFHDGAGAYSCQGAGRRPCEDPEPQINDRGSDDGLRTADRRRSGGAQEPPIPSGDWSSSITASAGRGKCLTMGHS